MTSLKKADTHEITELAKDIISLATDYETEINNLFRRFSNVPLITREWVGNEAEQYFNIVSFDQQDYINIGETIKAYANKLIEDAESIDETINNVLKEENNDKN